MRTLRLSLVGTVMLGLLGGLGGVALAQDEAKTPVVVTGLDTCSIGRDATCEVVDGIERCRGQVAICSDQMSDARVTGDFRNTANSDCFDSGCLYWGTSVLDRPDGGWDCTWFGLDDPYPDSGNDGLVHAVCPGTGAYEGLTYTWYHVFAFTGGGVAGTFGDGTDMYGLIYADELPSLTPPTVTEQ